MGVGVDYAASSSTRGKSWPGGRDRRAPARPAPHAAARQRRRRPGPGRARARMRSAEPGMTGQQQDRHGPQALGEAEERLVELARARAGPWRASRARAAPPGG